MFVALCFLLVQMYSFPIMLCVLTGINFTNEALQQQFNKFIFKLEQEEYEREQISWAFIEFPDNQDCLDTIQARPKGILALLDDECKLGQRGNDRNWANKLNQTYLPNKNQEISDNTRYSATKMQQAKGIFCVRHFAGNVQYTAETNFLEKNRDEIPLTAKSLFEQDSSDLIKEIYAVQMDQSEDKTATQAGKPAKQKTVSQQFKLQLNSLIEMIEKTDPHYIRCLKPNDAAKPKLMTRKRLTEQLRYGGVLEAVRVARMGYPVRLDHSGFFKRYRMLLPSISENVLPWSMEDEDAQKLCVKFLDILLEEGAKPVNYANEDGTISRANKIRKTQKQPEPMVFPKSDVQLGLSKVFMRKGPHDKLESHRVFHQNASITLIQSWVRGLQQERRYLIKGDAALTIERWYRGCMGRARYVLNISVKDECIVSTISSLTHFIPSLQLVETSRGSGEHAPYKTFSHADQPKEVQQISSWNCSSSGSVPGAHCAEDQCCNKDSIFSSHACSQKCLQKAQISIHCTAVLCTT